MHNMMNLGDVALIEISSVDKKIKESEELIKLCNFVDVYRNWAITSKIIPDLMEATANKNEIERFMLKKGQVAITKDSETRNDIGMSTYIADDLDNTLLGYHCTLITPDKKKLNGKYLNAFLNSIYARKHFENNASGSGQRYTLTVKALECLKIPILSLEKQNKIGNLFSIIDRKIEANNKINSELESMAKTIYDYWFLQFEFPNEEGKPYKSSGGNMVWNEELGREIPEGWEVKNVDDYCRIFTGKKDVNQALDKGKYKFYSCAPSYRYSNEKLYEGKAILISGNGSYTGRTILVDEPFDLYQRTYACVNNTSDDIIIYIFYSLIKFFVPRVQGGTHGSAIPYIVYDDIAKHKVLIDNIIIKKFISLIQSIQKRVLDIHKENQQLSSIRDFLLPLLMNGQVGFKENINVKEIVVGKEEVLT